MPVSARAAIAQTGMAANAEPERTAAAAPENSAPARPSAAQAPPAPRPASVAMERRSRLALFDSPPQTQPVLISPWRLGHDLDVDLLPLLGPRGTQPLLGLNTPPPIERSYAAIAARHMAAPTCWPKISEKGMSSDAARTYAFYLKHRALLDTSAEHRRPQYLWANEGIFGGERVVFVSNRQMLYVSGAYHTLPVAKLTAAEREDPPECSITLDVLTPSAITDAARHKTIVEPIAIRPTPTSLHVFTYAEFLKWWIVRGTNPNTRGSCSEQNIFRLQPLPPEAQKECSISQPAGRPETSQSIRTDG